MAEKKIPLVAVVGPTASGKTRLAIELCKAFDGEVVSGDSMQLYKQLSIATAKPTAEEQQEVPHHLIDLLEPWESFSVAQYTALAHSTIGELHNRGKLSVVTGGTGLYIRSLIDNIAFAPEQRDELYREELRQKAKAEGNEAVHALLCKVDPQAAKAIHPNNLGRVIRALEVFRVAGTTMTQRQQQSKAVPSPYDACIIGIGCNDRQKLYDRIDLRVDNMLKEGLLDEARLALSMQLSPTAAQAIGYKEFIPYFEGRQSLEEATAVLKQQTRNYAKRQLTWFKREEGIHWLMLDNYNCYEELVAEAVSLVKKALIDFGH
ncbi:MAG: tRNA (adenosine(37)-N6)-dimethylallyltransferase MiaA [Angelakisella sp.]